MKPSERMAALEIALPKVPAPVGSYVPAIRSGHHVLTCGQLPMRDGELVCMGKVGSDVTVEEACAAAGLAALNGLAAAAEVAGGLDRKVWNTLTKHPHNPIQNRSVNAL